MSRLLCPAEMINSRKMFDSWEDLRAPAAAHRLFSPAGRITFDFANHGLSFAANATYAADYTLQIFQLSHTYRIGSSVEPHIHWEQNQNQTPNWIAEVKWYNIGAAIPVGLAGPYTLATNRVAWPGGSIHQVTEGLTLINGTAGISSIIELRLYRDTANATGLFGGADPYGGAALVKEVDIHFPMDASGSMGAHDAKWG